MIVPKGHRVLVLADKVEQKSAGGIILHTEGQANKERVNAVKGTVVAIGPTAFAAFDKTIVRQSDGSDKVIYSEKWAKVGDRVIFSKYGGILMEDDDGVEYVILNDEDIAAVLEPGSYNIEQLGGDSNA